jgi:hypothetical protein
MDYQTFSVDKAIIKAGGFGLFQWVHFLICATNSWAIDLVLYNFTFLNLRQHYWCDPLGERYDCSEVEDICINGSLRPDIELNFGNERTIYNWITQLGIECEPAWKTSLFGSLYF